jgi:5-methylcytosine-specific restriction endonuclease McrA
MPRKRNTDVNGSSFSVSTKDKVWEKGKIIPGYDKDLWRYDVRGKPIKCSEYGNTDSKNGWEIDHIVPVAKGGTDDLSNLQPLQWEVNREKGDIYPW